MTGKYIDREIESLADVLGAHALKILKTNGVKNIKDLLALLDEHGEMLWFFQWSCMDVRIGL